MIRLLTLYFLILLTFSSCSNYNDVDHTPSVVGDIVDSESWYSDMVDEVLEMRVFIPTPNDFNCTDFNDTNGTLRPCSLSDVKSDTDANDDYEPMLHVRFETDDFLAPDETMNASFEQKGKTTRKASQKSFRIKLDNSDNLYRGERTFQLNKHPYDDSRVRNKLAFDIFKTIPHITTLKTEFVYLDINDTNNTEDINATDHNLSNYGLFTHVEKVGKDFLLNRGWDKDDNLWKAQNFSFELHEELAIDSDGQPIDPEAFDSRLEIERGKDQTKLNDMLIAINSSKVDFNETFKKYFNRKNYITWLAINIVTGNKDTVSQNFFLYSPKYSDTFYFLPWDYDGAGLALKYYAKWELGIANWWGVPLHNRFLRIKENRDELDAMVDHLRKNYITPEIIQARLDVYEPLITKYLSVNPDLEELERVDWEKEFNILIPRLDENINSYRGQLGHPMSFWQDAEYENGALNLNWNRSVDLEEDVIVYDLQISDSCEFNTTLISEVGLSDTPTVYIGSIDYSKEIILDPGIYYMKVISRERDNPEHYQIAFDTSRDINGVQYFGVLTFEVK